MIFPWNWTSFAEERHRETEGERCSSGKGCWCRCDTRRTCFRVNSSSYPHFFLSHIFSIQRLVSPPPCLSTFASSSFPPHSNSPHPISLSVSLSLWLFLFSLRSQSDSITANRERPSCHLHTLGYQGTPVADGKIKHCANVHRAKKHWNIVFMLSLSWSPTNINNRAICIVNPFFNLR